MGDFLNNEVLEEEGVPTDEWLTRKLWGFASEPPFLHHGRATLISEAILSHGGEADASRASFAALSADDQAAVIEFLETLQHPPEDAADDGGYGRERPTIGRGAVGSSGGRGGGRGVAGGGRRGDGDADSEGLI